MDKTLDVILEDAFKDKKILLVGAGGIGCEIAKGI
jgi:molybdopterin/thiamine biosynthesis adenylyltransferase